LRNVVGRCELDSSGSEQDQWRAVVNALMNRLDQLSDLGLKEDHEQPSYLQMTGIELVTTVEVGDQGSEMIFLVLLPLKLYT
jgi:hypothetical protein